MKNVVIATFEGEASGIFAGIKEAQTEKLFILTQKEFLKEAAGIAKELEKFKIETQIVEIEENSIEEVFNKISEIKEREKQNQVILNVSNCSGIMKSAALCTAFINGLKAFEIIGEKTIVFPIMSFSYYDLLSDKKMNILKALFRQKSISSLEELGRTVNLSPSLLNYHLYGNEKNPGLKSLGLINAEKEKGKIVLELTQLGKLLLKQRIEKEKEGKKIIIA